MTLEGHFFGTKECGWVKRRKAGATATKRQEVDGVVRKGRGEGERGLERRERERAREGCGAALCVLTYPTRSVLYRSVDYFRG